MIKFIIEVFIIFIWTISSLFFIGSLDLPIYGKLGLGGIMFIIMIFMDIYLTREDDND